MQSFKWDDLQVFLAVVREGSLSGAARALGVNHSTAWRRIGALEEALGARLFDRLPEGYALTWAGESLLPRAQAMEEEACAMEREVSGAESLPAGEVVLTAPEAMLPVLTPIVLLCRDRWPAITLDIQLGDRLYDLARREADVAIRPGPQPPPSVVGRRVCGVSWTVYGPASASPKECAGLPWVGYGEELAELAAERWRRGQGEEAPGLTVSSVPAMACVLGGAPLRGMLPCFVGDADARLRRLAAPIDDAGAALWLLVHADLRRSARVRAVVDLAWEGLRGLSGVFEGS